ncbi:MAG: hypothetical protein K6V73_07715 [Firmicutes bacterium]|nr:hypothetical protein [Bacillota bacterium]
MSPKAFGAFAVSTCTAPPARASTSTSIAALLAAPEITHGQRQVDKHDGDAECTEACRCGSSHDEGREEVGVQLLDQLVTIE